MCHECGSRDPGRRFAVDGTGALLCASCARDAVQIAWAHERVRRIHRAAHGFDSPCPICEEDAWLAGQKLLEAAETATAELHAAMAFDAEGTLLEAKLEQAMDRLPQQPWVG